MDSVDFLAESQAVSGPVNICAPELITNAEFTKTLARILRRPAILPVPSTALKMALGELSQMLLQAPRVKPDVLMQSGFDFRFPSLYRALRDILGQ